MVLDAAGLSSQPRTRVRTAEAGTREAWQPWRGLRFRRSVAGSNAASSVLPCSGVQPVTEADAGSRTPCRSEAIVGDVVGVARVLA